MATGLPARRGRHGRGGTRERREPTGDARRSRAEVAPVDAAGERARDASTALAGLARRREVDEEVGALGRPSNGTRRSPRERRELTTARGRSATTLTSTGLRAGARAVIRKGGISNAPALAAYRPNSIEHPFGGWQRRTLDANLTETDRHGRRTARATATADAKGSPSGPARGGGSKPPRGAREVEVDRGQAREFVLAARRTSVTAVDNRPHVAARKHLAPHRDDAAGCSRVVVSPNCAPRPRARIVRRIEGRPVGQRIGRCEHYIRSTNSTTWPTPRLARGGHLNRAGDSRPQGMVEDAPLLAEVRPGNGGTSCCTSPRCDWSASVESMRFRRKRAARR